MKKKNKIRIDAFLGIQNLAENRVESVDTSAVFLFSVNLPSNIYLFKVNNRNSRQRCAIYSKLQ